MIRGRVDFFCGVVSRNNITIVVIIIFVQQSDGFGEEEG